MNIENNRYQLIYPITGNKVYSTSDLYSAGYKCYEELKNLDIIGDSVFVMKDVDSGNVYVFKINNFDRTVVDNKNYYTMQRINELEKKMNEVLKCVQHNKMCNNIGFVNNIGIDDNDDMNNNIDNIGHTNGVDNRTDESVSKKVNDLIVESKILKSKEYAKREDVESSDCSIM